MEKMAKVFLISSHYMGVLYMDELLKAGDEIVGVLRGREMGAGMFHRNMI